MVNYRIKVIARCCDSARIFLEYIRLDVHE